MSHSLIATSSFSSTFTVPDNGDTGLVSSVNVPFQALLNNDTYLFNKNPPSFMPQAPVVTCDSAGNINGATAITIKTPFGIMLSGTYFLQTSSISIGVGDAPGGTLTANTWYYIYAKNNAGSLSFYMDTTPPVGGQFHTSDNTNLFIQSVLAQTSASFKPFRRSGDVTLFTDSVNVISLSIAPATTASQKIVTGATVPAHVNEIYMFTRVTNAGSTPFIVVGSADITPFDYYLGTDDILGHSWGGSFAGQESIWQTLDDNGNFRFAISPNTSVASFYLRGYRETN